MLIVPMSLIRDAYRAEIFGGLADAGEEVLHVFLEADVGVLRERLNARVTHPGRAGRRGAGCGWLAPGSRRRQADAAGKIAGLKRYLT
jgi:hypothetical protein